ncbi:MAG: hypothetical protein GC131_00165 [Alphaproteobacteria bacterium]|nr:hypothetical protein [Alphaproteobacteria bacterium]
MAGLVRGVTKATLETPSGPTSSVATTFFKRCLSLLISAGLLGLLAAGVFSAIDWSHVQAKLMTAEPAWLAATFALLLLGYPLNTYRFAVIVEWLTGKPPAFMQAMRITWLGSFLTLSAPFAALGDMARAGLVKWLMKLPLGQAVQSILFDRGLSMLCLIVLALFGAVGEFNRALPENFMLVQVAVLIGCLAVMALVLGGYRHVPWPQNRIGLFIHGTLQSLSAIVLEPRRFLVQMAISFVNVIGYVLAMTCLARAFDFSFDILNLILFAPLILLAINLPIFYYGWGGRETVMLMLLAVLAPTATSEAVLAASFAYGILLIFCALPGGLFLFGVSPKIRKDIGTS